MIYIVTDTSQYVLVLEPQNIEKMKSGYPVITPDKRFMIAYSPDIQWTADKLKETLGSIKEISVKQLDAILAEGLKREPVFRSQPQKNESEEIL